MRELPASTSVDVEVAELDRYSGTDELAKGLVTRIGELKEKENVRDAMLLALQNTIASL